MGRYPGGASPWGVEDLVGSVWQYTSVFQDNHTKAVALRGGSNWFAWRDVDCRSVQDPKGQSRARCTPDVMSAPGSRAPHPFGGSHWYFRQTLDLGTFNRYFLMSGSYEASDLCIFVCVCVLTILVMRVFW